MKKTITRRATILGSASAAFLFTSFPAQSESAVNATTLKPGQWEWYPERAESGPVAVIVSLSDQLAFVYRDGIRIGVSTVSTGKKGHETPTGVFTVLRKEKMHHSSKYNNAPMPDSQFFFGGCALHAGGLPGYPSSHGCVHLPRPFADRVFGVTHNGTPVIVTNERAGIGSLKHAGLVMTQQDLKQIEKLTGHVVGKKLPTDINGADSHAFAIVVSAADKKLIALKNGEVFLETPVTINKPRWPVGTHVYMLKGVDKARRHFDWLAMGLGGQGETAANQQIELAATTRMVVPADAYARVAAQLHPGATMMLTDLPAHPSTRTSADFVIMRDRRS